MDKEQKLFWQNLSLKGSIVLEDEDSIKESIDRGNGANGITYSIKKKVHIAEQRDLVDWYLFELEDVSETVWLLIKVVDENIDAYVYFEDEAVFCGSSRAHLIDRGDCWLFEEPENLDEFIPGDLYYAGEFNWEVERDGRVCSITYNQKEQGELFGKTKTVPAGSGEVGLISGVVEYISDSDCENPNIFIWELGGVDDDGDCMAEGGYVRLFFGYPVNLNEVDVLV